MRCGFKMRAGERGYTVIEVSVIIVVLTILAAILMTSALEYQVRARDSERAADVAVIARGLERYYRTQAAVTGPTYPASSITAEALATVVDDDSAILAPDQTTNSLVIATSAATQSPTIKQYVYQPLSVDGSLCSSAPCPRFVLYYRTENTSAVMKKESLRQQ